MAEIQVDTSNGASTVRKARLAGGLWLILVIGLQVLAAIGTPGVFTSQDPAATAARVLGAASQLRLEVVEILIAWLAYVLVTVLLWEILRPVNKTAALLAAAFGCLGSAIGMPAGLAKLAPLIALEAGSLAGIAPDQVEAVAYLSFDLGRYFLFLSWIMFGVQCSINGYLIMKSTFLPTVLGALLGVGGMTYVLVPFTFILSPDMARPLLPVMFGSALLGEGALSLWLLIKGLDGGDWDRAWAPSLIPLPRAG